jgi:peptide chain release factor 2
LEHLQKQSEDAKIWDDPKQAQQLMKDISELKDELNLWNSLDKRISDTLELSQMEDPTLNDELTAETEKINRELNKLSLSTLLGGKYDKGNALLTINTGEGGTDAQDWAGMLERMYLRWCETKGFKTEILDQTEGEEAGIKTVTVLVSGTYAYGYLKAEKGVHRLVRLSPYDSAHRRHTSFAQVEILPEAAQEDPLVVIGPDEVKIDIFKSSGAGGQNVQKNSTAIRLTHLPTGIVVTCQNERSQLQNRENAMRVLRSRLLDIAQVAADKNLSDLRGVYQKAEWGSQIRSYVLHPYQMVKDHRTDYEVGNSQSVLDGDLDGFIEAWLKFNK